ncbi:MAG: hypothetical protein ACMG6E_05250, partial [Candidatus Roizmanbacteria bacterium]
FSKPRMSIKLALKLCETDRYCEILDEIKFPEPTIITKPTRGERNANFTIALLDMLQNQV